MPLDIDIKILEEAANLGANITGGPKTGKVSYEKKAEIVDEFLSTVLTLGKLNEDSEKLEPQEGYKELKGSKLIIDKKLYDSIPADPFDTGDNVNIQKTTLNTLKNMGLELKAGANNTYTIDLKELSDVELKRIEIANAVVRKFIYESTHSSEDGFKLNSSAESFFEDSMKRLDNATKFLDALPQDKILKLKVNDDTEIYFSAKLLGKNEEQIEKAIDEHFDSNTLGKDYLELSDDGKYLTVKMDRVFGDEDYTKDLAEGFAELAAENKKGLAENQPHNKPKPRGR